jgi:preprotein translocase subunit SecD
MLIRWNRFNIYLLAAVTLSFLCGCQSAAHKRKKQASTLELHMESRADASEQNTEAKILRDHPITLTIAKEPFLNEANVKSAKVVDVPGGFELQIEFDQHGTWVLEAETAENLGKHIAVLAQFGEELKQTRWLGAPMIHHRMAGGVLAFTPDATREEAEAIALGLNNIAKKVQLD